jgi:hypothetical protein
MPEDKDPPRKTTQSITAQRDLVETLGTHIGGHNRRVTQIEWVQRDPGHNGLTLKDDYCHTDEYGPDGIRSSQVVQGSHVEQTWVAEKGH